MPSIKTASVKTPLPRIILELPEHHSSTKLARLIGRNLLEHQAVTVEDIDDVETLVGELCSNVTRHAKSAQGFFRIILQHQGDKILLIVEDHGPGFDIAQLPSIGSLRSDGEEERYGGFGLALVHHLADVVRFETRSPCGTRACIEKKLRLSLPQS